MRLTDFKGRQVVVAGYGREGAAACRVLRARFPQQSLTLVCPEAVSLNDRLIDHIREDPANCDRLLDADILVLSPGISPYRGKVAEARSRGIRLTSGTEIFFSEQTHSKVVCVTGTQGKSTTVALTAHLLSHCGLKVMMGGNIGVPALDLLEVSADVIVLEVSSYQARGLEASPTVAACLNLHPEHLDWHGTLEQYYADKLDLLRGGAAAKILNYLDPQLRQFGDSQAEVVWFNHTGGIHVRDDKIWSAGHALAAAEDLRLVGRHNLNNACAALTIVDTLGYELPDTVAALSSFSGLPHRLQILGSSAGVTFVNDSISTTPTAVMAALDAFDTGPALTLIVGGYSRGLDWSQCIAHLKARPPGQIVALYEQGRQILDLLQKAAVESNMVHADSLVTAVAQAKALTPHGGLVLLSPGAPSFTEFENFEARGRAFAGAAGLSLETQNSKLSER